MEEGLVFPCLSAFKLPKHVFLHMLRGTHTNVHQTEKER
ncbi:hypothetical protein BSI_25940 [Bacillus inaquosorum KCTC 13429]|uniref:Uncharacterized protein n=1 Tax=Bacillus inaquosorum KCTC 13429 TaxID=1236548 RepID=A0A9W5LI68_9BACI|nr:hypothetical protein BSI_25940 [Bacillus inaquosorum KCTC 13429]